MFKNFFLIVLFVR